VGPAPPHGRFSRIRWANKKVKQVIESSSERDLNIL